MLNTGKDLKEQQTRNNIKSQCWSVFCPIENKNLRHPEVWIHNLGNVYFSEKQAIFRLIKYKFLISLALGRL